MDYFYLFLEINFRGKVDYPFVDMEYACVTNYLNMEISWDAGFGTLVIAKREVELINPLLSGNYYEWQLDKDAIECIKLNAELSQLEQLNEIRAMIPSNVPQLERLKNNSEENSRSSDISEDQQAQNRLEVEITEKFIQYVRIYYNEKIDESIHALSIETVGPVSSTAPLAEHMEETIDKVLQQ
ncbi:unnamed protein product [Adineta steineri]|uniref:Uncharacterized protein n=1 Tax=Adineta steineri TaxID=433720 RepID=A0A814QAV4_9BILA|nr:unnamed protein product [Adineta steineri]